LDCRHCGEPEEAHGDHAECAFPLRLELELPSSYTYIPIGWDDHATLGLSIGCYYSYKDTRIHWFDRDRLYATMQHLVETAPLLVSYNGLAFDGPLMRAVLLEHMDRLIAGQAPVRGEVRATLGKAQRETHALCDAFAARWTRGYDVLHELWRAFDAEADGTKYGQGLYSLDAVARANELGGKTGHGSQAPRDWAAGRWAAVLEYCQYDVYLTKALFERACTGLPVCRGDGEARVVRPPEVPS
jgi:Predicted 3'-5' exonuclease related to the exonuclease domain of PolB